ncbi:MAG: FAD-dependent monooxygenase [Sphingobium sp.]
MRRTYPIILGGGPAGAAAAIALARRGGEPLLLEKQIETSDALCGGFLSWATLRQIAALGITPAQLGGQYLTHLTLHTARRAHSIPLPAPAMGVSRHRLDGLLLKRAEQCGAIVRRGCMVKSIAGDHLMIGEAEQIAWTSLFLASGKQDVRGGARDIPCAHDPELGLRMRLPASAKAQALLAGQIELHLFDRGYLGLVLQEDGTINACMAVRKSRLNDAGGRPATLFTQIADASPALADRLGDLSPDHKIDAIGHVPYGWRALGTWPGLYRLGDQAAVIPSLAGEGIGIALASAARAAQFWRDHGPAGAILFQRSFAHAAAHPLYIAGLAKALGTRSAGGAALMLTLAQLPGAASLVARLTRIARDGG